MSKTRQVLFIVLLAVLAIAYMLTLSGCDSFKEVKPQILEEYPECVVMLNTGEIYKGDKDKSGTVTPVVECIKSIKRQRCAKEVFNKFIDYSGKKIYVIDWGSDKDKMNQFNECMLK